MKRVVLRAEYKTEYTFNEGYICIEEDDNKKTSIEGIFGLDYVRIDFSDHNTFDLVLVETIYKPTNQKVLCSQKTTIFTSQKLFSSELYCPEQYLLCDGKDGFLSLSLIERERDISKTKEIYQRMIQLRP